MDELAHIISLLRAFDIEPKPLDHLLDAYLRRHPELSSSRRRLIADVVFGVMRWRRRLDAWLVQCGKKPDHRLRALSFLRWRPPPDAHLIPIDSLAEVFPSPLMGEGDPAFFPEGEAAYHSLPDFLWKMMVTGYGFDAARVVAESLNREALPVLRINTLKDDSREKIMAILSQEGIALRPTSFSPYGILLDRRINLSSLTAYTSGLIEVQDEASQLAVIAADPKPGERVLDMCAGAGGKSLMMAMLMQNKGSIIVTDPDERKLHQLALRAKRAGVSIVTREKKNLVDKNYDLVFVDAPCSGTGTLRRSPDIRWRITRADVERYVGEQKKLLTSAAKKVRVGGRLLYATCSILPGENEDVVREFLSGENDEVMDLRKIFKDFPPSTEKLITHEGFLRTDPRWGELDGFFAALLVRKGT